MKTDKAKMLGAIASTTLLASSMAPMAATALAQASGQASGNDESTAAQQGSSTVASTTVSIKNVQGSFAYSQDELTSNSDLARYLRTAPLYICNAGNTVQTFSDYASLPAADWPITIDGDVESSYVATIGELSTEGVTTRIMGCTCAGNPADGRATANANVTGVMISSLVERSGVSPDANTVTFTSSDGFTVSLPLFYVQQHSGVLVYEVNDAPLSDSVGGTNQLWLGSTSARYYTRDVVRITFSTEDEPPAAPGTPEAGDTYDNVPNVGVTSAGA